MRGILFAIFLSVLFVNLRAQTIQVLNAKTGQAIEGVLLVSEKFSTQTDQEGKVKIDYFTDDGRIIFQHASFLKHTSSKAEIERQGQTVMLIEDPVRLNEIVVSVNRWEQARSEIPNTIKAIQKEEILRYNPQTSADMLGQKGGVFIQKSQMGGGSPMIRGFSANRVLVVVDGIRMNNAIYRSGNLHNVISIDANSLENTEIIFGPGSVIYGSDALGGVMSFNTLKPKLSTSENMEQTGRFFSRFSWANLEKTIHTTYNIGTKKWAAAFSATFTDFDNLRMGRNGPDEYLRKEYVLPLPYRDGKPFNGTDLIIQSKNPEIQKHTAYDQFNLLGKIRFRPNENLDFLLNVQHSQTSNIPRYDRLIEYKTGALRNGQWYYGPQKLTLISGQMQYKQQHRLFDKMNVLCAWQNYEESRNNRKLNTPNLAHRTENLGIYSMNIDFGKEIDKKNELFYGTEVYLNHIASSGVSEDLLTKVTESIASRYPDGSNYVSAAGYVSYTHTFSEKLILQLGSRYTSTRLKGEFDSSYYNFLFSGFNMKNSAFNGNLGMVWHPTQNWQINIHSSTGFRSPNMDDVAKVFDSEPGIVVVPNPELKPEYARNLELSVLRSYSNKARIEITGFYTWLNDAMVRREFQLNGQDSIVYDGEMSKVEALVNAESARVHGFTFSLEYLFSNTLRTRNDITYTRGEDVEGNPLRHVPPTFGSSHLIVELAAWYVDLYVDYSGKLSNDKLAPDEKNKPHLYLPDHNGNPYSPSWWTVNLKGNYTVSQTIILGAGVENILNKRYRTYSSGMVAPGTNFIISLNARF